MIEELMREGKTNQRESIKNPSARLKDKIPESFTAKQTEDFIIKAVEHYAKYLRRQREYER